MVGVYSLFIYYRYVTIIYPPTPSEACPLSRVAGTWSRVYVPVPHNAQLRVWFCERGIVIVESLLIFTSITVVTLVASMGVTVKFELRVRLSWFL